MRTFALGAGLFLGVLAVAEGMVINEIMYHPRADDEANYEWVELYNDHVEPFDIDGWSLSKGISFTFPRGTVVPGKGFLVVCANKANVQSVYGLSESILAGPFEGRLDNAGEEIALLDRMGTVMARVRYRDRDPWPAGADGTGRSLALINPDFENDESESWGVSPQPLGSPGQHNRFEVETTIVETVVIGVGENWKYFKGTEHPSDPVNAWIEPEFDDSAWLSGPTGIGYGDDDDATILADMQNGYLSVFCRKSFDVTNLSSIDALTLKVAYDDGFIAYLNGNYVDRRNMGNPDEVFTFEMPAAGSVGELPEWAEISVPKSFLRQGKNVLAIQIHNASAGSTDLSLIPSLVSRKVKTSGGLTPMPVVINEFLANPARGGTGETFIELFNDSNSQQDIGLTYLSDDPDNLTKYAIAAGTILQPWDTIVFSGTEMGFQLSPGEGAIYFTTSDKERIVDAYAYGAALPGISRGRYPDGERRWYNMLAPTPGEANEVSVNTSIVINEIMYQPYEAEGRLEYVELYNRGSEAVDISLWRFSKGVDFTFPPGTIMQPDEYLVVAEDQNAIASKYGISNVIGNYTGHLDNEGEKIELVDFLENVVDEVRYAGGEPWPIWAAGWGSSLELIDPRQDNSAPSAWAASDERNRAEWANVQYTGRFNGGESEFHFFLMHRGECLIDDISMTRGGQELISNGSFESGTSGWKIEGNHIQSTIQTKEAHGGSRCLKIVATGRGDTGANRIECDTTGSLISGQSYTVSFWVKWQRGINLIYTRTHNQGVARASRFPMPEPRGTPGRQNSVYSANIGPVISDVKQNPILPKSSEPVGVTARISDCDGAASAALYYKGDADGTYSSVQMFDDGLHDDRRAGDGLYAGKIPARGNVTLMRFYIVATDALSASQRFPAEEGTFCLYQIEDSPPSTRLPIYRILLTREVTQKLQTRARLSNELEDCTFVLNNSQIYYNCGIRTRGSGWTRSNHPTNSYRIRFPADKPLRGTQREINLDARQDDTKQHERAVHYLLRELGGIPTSYHRYVHVRFNANFAMLAEDVLKVDGDFVRLYWPDDDQGNLFKADDHFEWTDGWSFSYSPDAYDAHLQWWGSDKEAYRWNWKLRTNEKEDDFSEFLDFVSFMDPNRTDNATFDTKAESVLDVDEWMKVLCVRFLVDDWDTLGYNRGKNAFIYKPYHRGSGTPDDPERKGRWALLPWDSDLTFGNPNAPIMSGSFPCILRMIQRPQFLRRYYSYYLALIDSKGGAFSRSNIDPVLDRTYQALVGEQGAPNNPDGMKSFITNRIAVIRSTIPSQPKFMVTTNSGADFEVDEPSVTLAGTAPFSARTMTVRINDGPVVQFEPTWTDIKNWRATFDIGPGENRIRLNALDWQNTSVGSYTITVTWRLSSTDDSDGDGLYDMEEVAVYHTDYMNPDTDGDGLKDGHEVKSYQTDPNKKDTDSDGLNDGDEVNVYSTNPLSPDTDSDSLPDKWEVENKLDPRVGNGDDGASGDPDGDGLLNSEEFNYGTNPRAADTDSDGMPDPWEIRWGLNPRLGSGADGPAADLDGDGLTNLQECQHGTNPNSADTDGDGLSDPWEVNNSLNPNSAEGNDGPDGDPDGDRLTNLEEYKAGTNPKSIDTDRDRMDDRWELQHGLNPNNAEGADGANGDPDGDGLSNLEEYQNVTNPTNPDTDGDGMDDFWEMENGLDARSSAGEDGPDGDPDGDGIRNLLEYQYGLDPLTANGDTDQDGMSDLWEVTYGLSPTNAGGNDGPEGDPDGDGRTNIQEMIAGTDPRSAASVFAVVSVNSNPPSISISWTTTEGRHYRILAADNPAGPWAAIAENLVGTGQHQTFTDEQAGSNGRRFYKVEVR